MIVVAGGSGLLGRLVVADLVARGESVRVLVRDADRAAGLLPAEVDIQAADVRHPEELEPVVAGASVLVSAVHGFLGGRGAGPAAVDHRGNTHLMTAARATGAEVRRCGTPWTVVRAAAFLETWLGILRQTAGKAGRPLVFGRGEQPIAFVSAIDVAAVVVRAATDSALRGQVLEIGGKRLTMNELAAAVQVGRGLPPRHLPRSMLRAFGTLGPVSPRFARQNRTALLMDSSDLGSGADELRAGLDLPPARTVADVLALTAPRPLAL
jgi:NADH dehydrogenase